MKTITGDWEGFVQKIVPAVAEEFVLLWTARRF
jgi:hypothetical protein